MKFHFSLLLLLLPILILSAVIDLNDTDLNKLRESKEHRLLVEFFAPWCGHCKRLAPIWTQLGVNMEEFPTVKVAKIDCDQYKATCKQYGVTGFPTIKLFKNDKVASYKGQRTVDALKAFATVTEPEENFALSPLQVEKPPQLDVAPPKIIKPDEETDVVVFEKEDAFESAIKTGFWVIKFHIGSGFDLDLQPTFQQLAAHYKANGNNIKVGKINVYEKESMSNKYNLSGFPTVAVLNNGKILGSIPGLKTFDQLLTFVDSTIKMQKRDEL